MRELKKILFCVMENRSWTLCWNSQYSKFTAPPLTHLLPIPLPLLHAMMFVVVEGVYTFCFLFLLINIFYYYYFVMNGHKQKRYANFLVP